MLYLTGGAVRDYYVHSRCTNPEVEYRCKDIDFAVELSDYDKLVEFVEEELKGTIVHKDTSRELVRAAVFKGEHFHPSLDPVLASAMNRNKDGKFYADFSLTRYPGAKRCLDKAVPIEQDLARRDLTMNAMALRASDGLLIDPCEGLLDIARARIRFNGDIGDRLMEDPLRVLRAYRFRAQLYNWSIRDAGKFILHIPDVRYMYDNEQIIGAAIRLLPKERVYSEVKKILSCQPTSFVLREVLDSMPCEILDAVFPSDRALTLIPSMAQS